MSRQASSTAGLPEAVTFALPEHVTGPDGRISVELPSEDTILAAQVTGSAPQCDVIQAHVIEHRLDLVEECVLRGSVRFDDGAPAAGARLVGRKNVHLERVYRGRTLDPRRLSGMFFRAEAFADSEGRYELRGLLEGMNLVEASLEGFAGDANTEVQVPWWPEHDFVLGRAAATLAGRVVDSGSDSPIEGAWLDVLSQGESGPSVRRTAVTRVDGGFRIGGVRAGEPVVSLRVYKDGLGTATVPVHRLLPGEERWLEVALGPGAVLEGTVRDTLDAPIEFAAVLAFEQSSGHTLLELMTDATGAYWTDSLPAATPLDLEFSRRGEARGLGRERFEGVTLPAAPLHVVLPACGVVQGLVTADGRPVSAGWARLGLMDETGTELTEMWSEIDAEKARFRFEFVPAGSHYLVVAVDGFAPARVDPVLVDPPATDSRELEVELQHGVPLRGRVAAAADGQPVAGAKVTLVDLKSDGQVTFALPRSVLTDGDGAYWLDAVPRGREVGIEVDKAPYSVLVESVLVPADATLAWLDVALPQGGTIRVRVEDEHGRTFPDTFAYLVGSGRQIPNGIRDAAGTVVFERVEPGPLLVGARSLGTSTARYGTYFQREVDLGPGESLDVTFPFSAGGRLKGRVLTGDGRGSTRLFNVYVKPLDPSLREYRQTDAMAGAEYQINGLSAGHYLAGARGKDAGPNLHLRRRFEIKDGEEVVLDFTIGPGSVAGSVVDLRGNPVPGAALTVSSTGQQPLAHTAESDPEGAFEVRGLEPDSFVFKVEAPGFARAEGEFELTAADPDATLRIELEPEATLLVAVVDPGGRQLVAPQVSCVPLQSALLEPQYVPARADDQGRVRFSNLSAGTYLIESELDPYFPASSTLVVGSGEARSLELALRSRAAALEILVTDPRGSTLPFETVLVRDRLTLATAADFIGRGWVVSETGGSMTSASGRLLLTGLPEGDFEIEVPGTSRVVSLTTDPEPARVAVIRF